ncbi:unnamed protein product [Amaranthus hypochondriacus]
MKLQPSPKTKRLETPKNPPISSPTSTLITSSKHQINEYPFFTFGSQVEVTSNEEGFRGAWYSATVISPSPSKEHPKGKILVEYKNLLLDENGSTLLQEFVDVDFVRPKPPIDGNDRNDFDLNEVVDAFYQDGWWCGVVSQVFKNRYTVFFSNPPDELEFDFSNLRIHKNWVDGNWVLPEKQRMRDLDYCPGIAVEVNIESDNSYDVWFPASFIKQVANSFLVEYQSKEAGFQKVAVDYLHIRPSPPSSSHKVFNLLEKVDAFFEYYWLSGVVTKILADGRYIVYFKRTKKEKELSHANLRLHMEWNNGKWTYSSQDTSMTSNSEKHLNLVNGSNKEKTRTPSEVFNVVEKNIPLNRVSTTTLRSGQKEPHTPDNDKTNSNGTTPSNIKLKQMKESNHGISADLNSPSPDEAELSKLKQDEKISQLSDPSEIKDSEMQSTPRKRGRPPKPRALPSAVSSREFVVQTPSSDMGNFGLIVVGLTHNGKMINSVGQSSSRHLKVAQQNHVASEEKYMDDHKSESEQQKEGEVPIKRKRGRPPKVQCQLGSPKTKEAERVEEKKDGTSEAKEDNENFSPTSEVAEPVTTAEPIETSDSTPTDFEAKRVININEEMERSSDIRRVTIGSNSRRQVKRHRKSVTGSLVLDLNEPLKPLNPRKGKRYKSGKLVDSQTEDDVDNSRIKTIEVFSNGVSRDVDSTIAGTSSNASDDERPLSAWFEGAQSLSTTGSRLPPNGSAGQYNESGERENITSTKVGQLKEKELDKMVDSSVVNGGQLQDKNVAGRPDQLLTQSIVPVEEQDLPFVKNSLIWKTIENMEVLKRIPQKPHFRPLYNCKEECREGLAIGSMVTFTSLVERISKACFNEPKSLLDGYLEALVDLEELGFNVAPVREKLNKMISIKGKFETAQNTSSEIESQIMERNLEKSTINEELADIDKKIGELMEKRTLVMSKIERKDAEITLLQTSIDAIKGTLETAEKEFEKLTTSLF